MADNTAPIISFPAETASPARPAMPPSIPPAFIAKLSRVLGNIHRVPKRGRNEFHRYDYATEADIMAAVRLPLAEEGLFIFSNIDHKDVQPWELGGGKGPQFKTTVFMTFYLCDSETGAAVPAQWQGEGIDNLDKGLAKAITAATKYFLKTTFLIATGDDPEEDSALDAWAQAPASKKSSPAKAAAKNPPPKAVPAAKPATPQSANGQPPAAPPTANAAPAPESAPPESGEPTTDQLDQLAALMKARNLNKTALQTIMTRELGWTVDSARDLDREQFTLLLHWFDTH